MEERRTIRRGKSKPLSARAKYRGRAKVQIQAYLSAIVQNLKRLLFPLYCWLLSALLALLGSQRARIAIQPIAPTNQLLKQKSIRTFSTRPTS